MNASADTPSNAFELFRAWAPEGAPWSPWAKPVLFSAEGPIAGEAEKAWQEARERTRWAAPEPGGAALVLDLPGPEALAFALDCAARGWRPVPLFNSCAGPSPVVDNEPLRAGLAAGAKVLGSFGLRDDAPPAFVLDARRLQGQSASSRFDNRWIVFPQDFPSAARLQASGVRRVRLVQHGRREPRVDLAHVLLRWQQAGLAIDSVDLAVGEAATPIQVAKPGLFRALGYRVFSAVGLRRNSAGGFGSALPLLPQGGGGFGGGFGGFG